MTASGRALPSDFQLAIDPDTRRPRRGVVIGGSPVRVLRFGEPAARLLEEWDAGSAVGNSPGAGAFARRLVDAGIAHPRPPGSAEFQVTIVIPVRDRPEGLRSTLDELARLDPSRRIEVIVVDDGSKEPVAAELPQGSGVTVIRRDDAKGPAAARNAGWRASNSEIIVFLDADCEPAEGWLGGLKRHFSDPAVAAVAPRIRSDESSGADLARYEGIRSSLDLGSREAPVRPRSRVPYVPTACVAVRREALEELGGFNETLRFGEDVDLVWRLHRNGWSVRYEPSAVVIHPPRRSVPGWLRQRFDYGRSAARLAELHGSDVAPLDVSPWSAAAWALVCAGHLVSASAVTAGTAVALARRAGDDRPTAAELARLAVRGNLLAGARIAEAVRRAWLPPASLALMLMPRGRRRRRTASALAVALSLPAVEWISRRPPLTFETWLGLRILDDLSYQAGLWAGVMERRSAKALLPRF